jgi:hypothetical protein
MRKLKRILAGVALLIGVLSLLMVALSALQTASSSLAGGEGVSDPGHGF